VIDTTIHAALSTAVADVLESMFFLEAVGEAAEPPPEAETVTAHLTFEGEPPGCFRMRLARSAASAIAADFLGEDCESLTPKQSTEVTLELANMICGATLSQIESGASFRLGTPEIVTGEAGGQGSVEETRYTVETGSGRLTVAIRMETRTCSPTEKHAS
jgi:CheY-specific phosphatase CheX